MNSPRLLSLRRLCTHVVVAFCALTLARAAPPAPGANTQIPDLKLDLIWIAPGTFTLGSPPDEPDRHKAEGPRTRVTLTQGFWLGKTELTQAHYEAIAGSNPSAFVAPDRPVEHVSWIMAMAFCEKLTERERAAGRLPAGYVYTLPTEAQWEYAYRAGSSDALPRNLERMMWHKENSRDETHPVAQTHPNPWGLYDLPGNVLEWCRDWYADYPGGDATDPAGPSYGHYRIARGGSWRMESRLGRYAARSGGSAGRVDYTIGFRVALCPAP